MPANHKIVSRHARLLRDAMVRNLTIAIQKAYPGMALTAAFEQIEEDTGISLSSMQRVMSGKTGPSIDTLATIAHNLGTPVSTLLTITKESLPVATGTPVAAAQSLRRRRRGGLAL